ncbi:MAG TPA: hypothetical protein VEY30_10795 [Myxococcaceae bacterium]|nr:hypothetical protein [Myxococcaceae bacterium]
MAKSIPFFMSPDDERAFFRFLEGLRLEVYPVRVPPNWKPFLAADANLGQVPEEAAYLVASEIGPALVDKIKRGPDKGAWRVDEVRSPVIYFERSRPNEDGELLSGKLWAEFEVTPQTGRRDPAPDRFRALFTEVEGFFKKGFRKSDPKGFWIGPHAARKVKAGLTLRDAQHRGGTISVHR